MGVTDPKDDQRIDAATVPGGRVFNCSAARTANSVRQAVIQ